MAPVMKRKAMKKMTEKKQKVAKKVEESEEEEDDEEEEASSAEEEQGESESEEEGEEDEEKVAKSGKEPRNIRAESNAAKKDVARVQRTITKLESKQKELAQKMKENKDAIRKAEKELEPLKAVLASKRRVLNKQNNEKLAAVAEKKDARARKFRKLTAKKLKAAQKRIAKINQSNRGAKVKAEDAKMTLKRAQSKFDECTATIKALKAKGEKVPEPGAMDDYSSPHAWKPPGYMAAKALAAAKEMLSKAQKICKEASDKFEDKDLKRKATLELVEEVKKKQKMGPNGAASKAKADEVDEVATPSRSSAGKAKPTKSAAGKKKGRRGR